MESTFRPEPQPGGSRVILGGGDTSELYPLQDIDPSDLLHEFCPVVSTSSTADNLNEGAVSSVSSNDRLSYIIPNKSQEVQENRNEVLSFDSNLMSFGEEPTYCFSVPSVEESSPGVISLPDGYTLSMSGCGPVNVSSEDLGTNSSIAFLPHSTTHSQQNTSFQSISSLNRSEKPLVTSDIHQSISLSQMDSFEGNSGGIVTPVIQVASSKKSDSNIRLNKTSKLVNTSELNRMILSPSIITSGNTVPRKIVQTTLPIQYATQQQNYPIQQKSTPAAATCSSFTTPLSLNASTQNMAPPNVCISTIRPSPPQYVLPRKDAITDSRGQIFFEPSSQGSSGISSLKTTHIVSDSIPKIIECGSTSSSIIPAKPPKDHEFIKPNINLDPRTQHRIMQSPLKTSSSRTVSLKNMQGNSSFTNPSNVRKQQIKIPEQSFIFEGTPSSSGANIVHVDLPVLSNSAGNKSIVKGPDNQQFITDLAMPSPSSPLCLQQNSNIGTSGQSVIHAASLPTSSPGINSQNNEINLLRDADDVLLSNISLPADSNLHFTGSLDDFTVSQSVLSDHLEESGDLQGLSSSLAAPDIFTANGIRTSFLRNYVMPNNLPQSSASSDMPLTFPSAFLDNSNMSIDISTLSDDDISVSNSNLIDVLDRNFSPKKSVPVSSDLTFTDVLSSAINNRDEELSKNAFEKDSKLNRLPILSTYEQNIFSAPQPVEQKERRIQRQSSLVGMEGKSRDAIKIKKSRSVKRKDPHQCSDTLLQQVYFKCRVCQFISREGKLVEEHMAKCHPDEEYATEESDSDDQGGAAKPKKFKVFLPKTGEGEAALRSLPLISPSGIIVQQKVQTLTISDLASKKAAEGTIMAPPSTVDVQKSVSINRANNAVSATNQSVIRNSADVLEVTEPMKVEMVTSTADAQARHGLQSILNNQENAVKLENKVDLHHHQTQSLASEIIKTADDEIKEGKDDDEEQEWIVQDIVYSQDPEDDEEDEPRPKTRKKKSFAPKCGRPFAARSLGIAQARRKNRNREEDVKLLGYRCDVGGKYIKLIK